MKRLLIASLLLIGHPSFADILGVADAELLITAMQQLSELKHQYQTLADTYQTAKGQLNSINQLKNMNSGHYGFGNLDNNLSTLQSWQSPVSTWDDALHNLSGGNPARYQALVNAYEKNHPALDQSHYAQYTNPVASKRFKEDKAVNRAVLVQTTEGYNDINKHMKALQELSKQIEKTENTKSAVDLNSRLVTEVAFIQLMSLRLQTLMSQQIAQESLTELQDRGEMAAFNHWDNKS